MLFGTRGRFGKVATIRKLLGEKLPNLRKRGKLLRWHGLEHDFVAMLFDQNLLALEAEGPRQADCLTASVLKDFRGAHGYSQYLLSTRWQGRRSIYRQESTGAGSKGDGRW